MSEIGMENLARRGEDVVKHYGVKGMRWGVRKSSDSGGVTLSPRAKAAIKTGAKIGVRLGTAAGLTAIGVPASVNMAVVALTDADALTYGRDTAKLILDDLGLINMGAVDKLSTQARTNESVGDFVDKIE